MVRLALEDGAETRPRRQHVGDADRLAAVDQRLALLDVHLEEAADLAQLVAAFEQRVAGDAVDRRRIAHRAEHGVNVEPGRHREAAEAGVAEAGALLVDERDHRQRLGARLARFQDRRDSLERAYDAEGAVVGAAVGLRVDMRARAHVRPVTGAWRDRPHVAGAVLAHVEPDALCHAAEPLLRLDLERRPCHPVPAGFRAADLGQLGEPP